jgi:hypothetical protein
MRTTSCAQFGREIYIYRVRQSDKKHPNRPVFALIQAALSKAASTNAMLADAVPAVGLAGASRSGACIQPARPSHTRSLTPRHAQTWLGKCARSGIGETVVL